MRPEDARACEDLGMGFCIWVADDPELADALSPYGSDPQVEPVPSNYPYFSASLRAMSALRQEMEAQGFGIVDAFVFNNGDHVPAEEIDLALRESVEVPLTLQDPCAPHRHLSRADQALRPAELTVRGHSRTVSV